MSRTLRFAAALLLAASGAAVAQTRDLPPKDLPSNGGAGLRTGNITSTGATVPNPGASQGAGTTSLDRGVQAEDNKIQNSICKGCWLCYTARGASKLGCAMNVDGSPHRTIWLAGDGESVRIVDQTRLPHRFEILDLRCVADSARAISDMQVRGAPLIGVTAAYGVAMAMRDDPSDANLEAACSSLRITRPTAVNLMWALDRMRAHLTHLLPARRREAAFRKAGEIAEADVELCRDIGRHGLSLLRDIARTRRGDTVNILTHCNAGWLATVDWGTATAPIYAAHEEGLPIHVFVDETRPRNQGAALTAWELGQHGVPHTVIVDNAGGHLMQHGKVDCVIVGTDRTTARGDVCNKIGTYLKALAAKASNIPFYVAAPSPSIDFALDDGLAEIPIEERGAEEVTHVSGLTEQGDVARVLVTPRGSPVLNFAFDVTPANLVTGLITERGVVPPTKAALAAAFPERVLTRNAA